MDIAKQLIGFLADDFAIEDAEKSGIAPEPIHILNHFFMVVHSYHVAPKVAMGQDSGNLGMHQLRRTPEVPGRAVHPSVLVRQVEAQPVDRAGIFPESIVRIFVFYFYQEKNHDGKTDDHATRLNGCKRLVSGQASEEGFNGKAVHFMSFTLIKCLNQDARDYRINGISVCGRDV